MVCNNLKQLPFSSYLIVALQEFQEDRAERVRMAV
jgi:hypothetical protein